MEFKNINIYEGNVSLDLYDNEILEEKCSFFLSDKINGHRATYEVPRIMELSVDNKSIIIEVEKAFLFFKGSNRFQLYCKSQDGYIELQNSFCIKGKFLMSEEFIFTRELVKKEFIIRKSDVGSFKISGPSFDRVYCRKRVDGVIGGHYQKEYSANIENDEVSIDYTELVKILDIHDNDIVDFFIESDGLYYILNAEEIDDSYVYQEQLIYKNYISKNNRFSIFFASKIRLYLKDVKLVDSKMLMICEVRGDIEQLNFDKVGHILSDDEGYIKNEFFWSDVSIEKNSGNEVILKFNNLIEDVSKYINEYTNKICFSIKPNENSIKTIIESKMKDKSYMVKDLNIRAFTGKRREAIYLFNIKQKINKVAIFGSCHSRRAFTATDYFNPEYKSKYEIVYTQFHSTIESTVCNYLRDYKKSDFEHFHPIIQEYIEIDFNKTFLKKLEESNADYVIIDMYADSQKYTIEFNDNSKISSNAYINRRCDYLLENCKNIINIKSPIKDEQYLEEWKSYAREFVNQITQIIDEKKIIINFISYAKQYKDKNGVVKSYANVSENNINTLNAITDYMQRYLSVLMPNARILDLREFGFIGDENHPDGLLIDHFESQYYKEFLKVLNKLIL